MACGSPSRRARSPESNGIAEAFVKTLKRDYARVTLLPNAQTARPPINITSDKNPTYGEAICELKRRHQLPPELEHRQVKYLNNRLANDELQRVTTMLNAAPRRCLGYRTPNEAFQDQLAGSCRTVSFPDTSPCDSSTVTI